MILIIKNANPIFNCDLEYAGQSLELRNGRTEKTKPMHYDRRREFNLG